MVKVPTNFTGEAAVDAVNPVYSSGNVPRGAFDGGASVLAESGKKLASTGDMLADLAINMQEEDNETEIKQRDVEISDAVRNALYGDGSQGSSGYLSTEQNGALKAYDETDEVLKNTLLTISNSSSNEAVRLKVAQMASARLSSARDRMTAHAAAQRVALQDSTSAAREAQAFDDAAKDFLVGNGTITSSISVIDDEVESSAARKGWSKEQVDNEKLTKRSTVVQAAFEAAIASENITEAAKILNTYSDDISGVSLAKMTKALNEERVNVKGQTLAEQAISKFPGDYEKQIEYVQKVSEGKVEDDALVRVDKARSRKLSVEGEKDAEAQEARSVEAAARAQVNHQRELAATQEKQAAKDAKQSWGDFIYSENATTPRTVAQFRRDHPEAFRILSGSGAIDRMQVEARNVELGNTFRVNSDNKTFAEFRLLPPEQKASEDLNSLRSSVTKSEWDNMVSLQSGARDRVQAKKESSSAYSAVDKAILRASGLSGKGTQKHRSMLNEAYGEGHSWVKEFIDSNNRVPTQTEIDRFAGLVAAQVVSDPSDFNSLLGVFDSDNASFSGLAVRRGRMSEEQRASARVPVKRIPSTINKTIDTALSRRGISRVDDGTREELAGAIVMQDGERIKRILKNLRGE